MMDADGLRKWPTPPPLQRRENGSADDGEKEEGDKSLARLIQGGPYGRQKGLADFNLGYHAYQWGIRTATVAAHKLAERT